MLKLFKRGQNIKLILSLLVFAFLHIYITLSLKVGESAFDSTRFLLFLKEQWLLSIFFIITFLSVYYVKRISKFLIIFFLGIIFIWNFYLFFQDFNKPLMLLAFIFFVVSLYFMGVWNFELEDAVYSPNFGLNDLEVRSLYDFGAWIETPSGERINGVLTNWDQKGCFFVPTADRTNLPKEITLKIYFEELEYMEKGEVVSSFGKGVGIRFKFREESGNFFKWDDFFRLIDDRGYRPKG